MGEYTCARHIGRDQRPARNVVRQDTDMMCFQNRKYRGVQDAVKITAKTEHVSAFPDAFCAAESTLQEQDGVKQRSDNKQRSQQYTGEQPEDGSYTQKILQDGIHQPPRRPSRS
ncbi:hypothetical protein HPB49_017731 [Dermacentor silvarum]|uniref:Uncharacterized protein n=1 Tax=Dermacentor silvarum TaxID=543639 RepID=A0ACB8DQC9_DERSI|nr:hypothetical protein HPB49_017731 [Dermacentor silvarum]